MNDARIDALRGLVREVPDFPKPGILFYDITPILSDPGGFASSIELLAESMAAAKPTAIVGIESRGFIFGAPLAVKLDVGFVPVRKPGKLPYRTRSVSYSLEYGEDSLEIHEDALKKGDRIYVVDDLLATGGTMAATCQLVEQLGAEVLGCRFAIELAFLDGRAKLEGRDIASLLTY